MSGPLRTFADLLVPILPETFFERHWENEPLHLRRSDSDQLPLIIAELERMTDFDTLLGGFARRIRSPRAGTGADFHTDVMAIDRRSNERKS
jgi:hypothetical protein